MSFLALVLAQPSMRQTVRSTYLAAPVPSGGESPQYPEIIASNLPEGDTLIGLKPLDTDTARLLTDSLTLTLLHTLSLSRI